MNVGLIVAMGILTLVVITTFGGEQSDEVDGESGQAGRSEQASVEQRRTSLPTWALVLIAAAITTLVAALLAWFTSGPGAALSTSPAL